MARLRASERPDDEINFTIYDDAEPLLFPTYMLLWSFNTIQGEPGPGMVPLFDTGHIGVYDASSDRASKSLREKFKEDQVILLKVLTDFCILSIGRISNPAEDEMIRGMREMVRHN